MKKMAMVIGMLGAFTGTAHAQSGVTLYGVLDLPIEYVNHMASAAPTVNAATGTVTQQPGGNRFALQTTGGLSGPRWGLRGVEDLGSGMQALYVLESGFGVDDGKSQQGGRLFGRQAFVGLRHGQYGTLTFGRQYTSMFDAFTNFGPLSWAPLYDPIVVQLGSTFREDNMMKYTGVFGGVTAVAHWSFGAGVGALAVQPLAGGGAGETAGHFRDNSAYGAALTYAGGPFGVAVGYDQWNPAVTVGNPGTVKKASVAASYSVGPAKFYVGYRWGDNKDATGNSLVRDDYYWIGANYQATAALSLSLGYYYDDLKTLRLSSTAPAANPANPWQVGFIADYTLSKRTDVYLTTAYAKNAGLNFDTSANGFANGYFLSQGSSNQFGAAVGIRHKF
ncbi:porin [Cupriavidus numazuensis]|uniref:Outer membrane porin protein n=1 Tax=Cupriavidus numazuensis TaxID=221992 RepID=A0ABM8TN67_9BURK|nr:porin [Cupriavidus numazuensis]CAG2155239.1 Outer membrane porin protein [Cupriavidus numazuensis]